MNESRPKHPSHFDFVIDWKFRSVDIAIDDETEKYIYKRHQSSLATCFQCQSCSFLSSEKTSMTMHSNREIRHAFLNVLIDY